MKTTLIALTIASLAGSALSAAEISGKVKLSGTPPPEKSTTTDAACGKAGGAMITSRHYVVGADKGLADVFVYVKAGSPSVPGTGSGATLDQISCNYSPYVMGLQLGQTLPVRNSDNLMHNVHMLPKVTGNKEKNVAQPIPMVSNFTIDKPEVFLQFKCDVHPWMFAYVGVVDNPYFAVTDKDGNFKITGLPAGEYTIEAIHRKAGSATEKIKVDADDKKTAEFTLKVPPAP